MLQVNTGSSWKAQASALATAGTSAVVAWVMVTVVCDMILLILVRPRYGTGGPVSGSRGVTTAWARSGSERQGNLWEVPRWPPERR